MIYIKSLDSFLFYSLPAAITKAALIPFPGGSHSPEFTGVKVQEHKITKRLFLLSSTKRVMVLKKKQKDLTVFAPSSKANRFRLDQPNFASAKDTASATSNTSYGTLSYQYAMVLCGTIRGSPAAFLLLRSAIHLSIHADIFCLDVLDPMFTVGMKRAQSNDTAKQV